MLIWNDPQDKILSEKAWFEERRMNKQNTEDLQGNETILQVMMVDTCTYTFVKIHRMYNTKSES